jgi:DNA-directed RNA polymerase specialized sigma subunit
MTQAQIAQVVGVSISMISLIERRALRKMRAALEPILVRDGILPERRPA